MRPFSRAYSTKLGQRDSCDTQASCMHAHAHVKQESSEVAAISHPFQVVRNAAERSGAAHLRGASQPRAESDGPQRPKLPPPLLPTLSYHPSPHAPYDFYGNIYPDALPTLHLRSRLHHPRPTLKKPTPTLPTSGAPPSLLTYLRIHLGGWIYSSPPPSFASHPPSVTTLPPMPHTIFYGNIDPDAPSSWYLGR